MDQSKIKVLHIIKSLGRGGAEMLLPEALKLHSKEEFEFQYIYFLPWKNQMVRSIEDSGGEVTCFAAANNIQLLTKVWAVARYVRQNEIQLIHAHLPWAGILARFVGKLTGIPVIYTEHNKLERYHLGTRVMNLVTMNLLKEVIAVSGDVADSIRKYKPKLKCPVHIILNGVNTFHFDKKLFNGSEIRARFGIPAESRIIGTVAVFRFQKRLDLWMELASKILEQVPDVHFIIVGDGPLKEELSKKRDSLGLRSRIHMPGIETEVGPYLAAFDIYMMSSIFEGLPIALLEAMAMECPVVSTDAGGIKEVIRHEVDGLLCSVHDPNRLIEYACRILMDKNLQQTLGAQSRRRVIESFSMEKMVGELEADYKRCIRNNS